MIKFKIKSEKWDNITYKYAAIACLVIFFLSVLFNIKFVQIPNGLQDKAKNWEPAACKIVKATQHKNYYSAVYVYEYKGAQYESDRTTFWPGGTKSRIQDGMIIVGSVNPDDPSYCVLFPKWKPVWYAEYFFNSIMVLSLVMSIMYCFIYRLKSPNK